jgi:hypothetical protein
MYDISDSITNGLTEELRSKIMKLDYLSPLKVLLGAEHAVLREVPGRVDLIPERSVKMRRDAAAEVLSSTVLLGDKAKLGLVGTEVTEQEEATKHDDAVIPYHFWYSRLTRLWDGEVIPLSDVAKAAEVIQEQFTLRFWKLKLRKSFFIWFRQRYKVHMPHQDMVAWNSANYVWTGNYKDQYAHYWKAMWGQMENGKPQSLLAAGDCITRAVNSTWWNWEDWSRPFFWR